MIFISFSKVHVAPHTWDASLPGCGEKPYQPEIVFYIKQHDIFITTVECAFMTHGRVIISVVSLIHRTMSPL